jgi:hypothetical protein
MKAVFWLITASEWALAADVYTYTLSPSRRREALCEGTNSPRLFTPREMKALAKSKVHQR